MWRLVFQRDVEAELLEECGYVEGRLAITPSEGLSLPDRVYRLYETLLQRDEIPLGIEPGDGQGFAERHAALVKAICVRLAGLLALEAPPSDPAELLRAARRRLRESKTDAAAPLIKSEIERLALNLRLGAYAFARETVTQEELAEHIKRIRNDHCKGSFRDTLNRYVPRPAGPRTAIIRVPEPIAMHDSDGSVEEALALLQARMQEALDGTGDGGALRSYRNPFAAARSDPSPGDLSGRSGPMPARATN